MELIGYFSLAIGSIILAISFFNLSVALYFIGIFFYSLTGREVTENLWVKWSETKIGQKHFRTRNEESSMSFDPKSKKITGAKEILFSDYRADFLKITNAYIFRFVVVVCLVIVLTVVFKFIWPEADFNPIKKVLDFI